jgi:hypothetical protein
MNRAQRRQQIKKINTPQKIEQFSAEMERRLRREYVEKSDNKVRHFIRCYTILTAYVLNDELGLGPTRLPKVLRSIQHHVDLLESDHIKIEELEEWLRDEKNIEFTWDYKKGGIERNGG